MQMDSVSVIIATFNSARTLPLVLNAIRKQTYARKSMEVLIIDGGSTDATLSIAKKFRCTIFRNSKVEPLYAKYLGYIHAKGKYIVYVDHDEVIVNPNSIKNKIAILRQNPDIKVVIASGYRSPKGYNVINRYINEFGDPFSFFMYRLSKHMDFFIDTMRRRYVIRSETSYSATFDLSSSLEVALVELAAGGGMFDGTFFKKKFPEIVTHYHLIAHLLHLLRPTHPLLAIVKDDVLLHYSSDDIGSYVKKISWRIRNNIFFTTTIGASGFSGRESYQTALSRIKKFLFLPYAFSVVMPSVDAMYLMATRRDMSYIIHLPLTIMTAGLIVYNVLLKMIGVKPVLKSYDGSTVAYENN